MADESTSQKKTATLAQIAARDHSAMLQNALNINPVWMQEMLGADSVAARMQEMLGADSVAARMQEMLGADSVAARMQEMLGADSVATRMQEMLTFDPSKAMQKALANNPYESIQNAFSNLKVYEEPVDRTVGFLEDLHVDVPELVEYIDEHIDTAEFEPDADPLEPEPDENPILEAIWHYVARSDNWVRAKYQQYSDPTIRALEYIAVLCIYGLLLTLASVLPVALGPPGIAMSVVLLGAGKFVDDKTKSTLQPKSRGALGVTCSTCGAFRDMWCVTTKGNNPGTPARSLHAPRIKQQ
jgi:hypothetical protein